MLANSRQMNFFKKEEEEENYEDIAAEKVKTIKKNKKEHILGFLCKCGKKYNLQSSLFNHIRISHDQKKDEFYIGRRAKGRPPKQSEEQKILNEAFIPDSIDLCQINCTLNTFTPYIIHKHQQTKLDGIILSKSDQFTIKIKNLSDSLDQNTLNWYDTSVKFFNQNFGFFLNIYSKNIIQFIQYAYSLSLLENKDSKNQIVTSFNHSLNSIVQEIQDKVKGEEL